MTLSLPLRRIWTNPKQTLRIVLSTIIPQTPPLNAAEPTMWLFQSFNRPPGQKDWKLIYSALYNKSWAERVIHTMKGEAENPDFPWSFEVDHDVVLDYATLSDLPSGRISSDP